MKDFIKQHSIIFYFLLTCTISWLCLLSIIGIDGFLGRTTLLDESMPLLFVAMVAGPVISGLISNYLMEGKSGLKRLVSRFLKWKIKLRFYLIIINILTRGEMTRGAASTEIQH